MKAFDSLVISIILISVILGGWRGVVGEIIALCAWMLAFLMAKWWGNEVANALFSSIADPTLRLLTAWVGIVIVILFIVSLVRTAMKSVLKVLGLSATDRALGVLFGVARGMLIVLALVAVGGMTDLPGKSWWRGAMFAAPLETVVLACKPWMPPEMARRIRFR
ncbi:MAG: CvpA family protein [Candidatus Accumulibacter sp.]|jgi:membrane protein required for colicin V production|nr:CvpA family protein [Accumulibacter sp.]